MNANPLTRARASELIELQSRFPYWGAFDRFMTADERLSVQAVWQKCPGNWSFASVIYACARGDTVPPVPAFADPPVPHP